MMQKILTIVLILFSFMTLAQDENSNKKDKKRLDFAKTYFELGGTYFPSFNGKSLSEITNSTINHSSSFSPYLTWGGFHFWGHAEFYVTFPLNQINFNTNNDNDFNLRHFVATGTRILPWALSNKKIRPYLGVSWSSLEFKQVIKPTEDQTLLSKDFMLVPDFGFLYSHNDFKVRVGLNYFHNNKWNYPISKTNFKEIKTPKFNLQFGLIYTFEASHDKNPEVNNKWNKYPTISKVGIAATKKGDFFIGIGPSTSFSLKESEYTNSNLPHLKNKISSSNYFDIAFGYQLNKAGIFSAISFRNPKFETEGYGDKQTIQKNSLNIEVNKFLKDYTGFVPFIGINLAFDHIKYTENSSLGNKHLTFKQIEPGITVGWDILPGKTDEYLILRTNLRWYPLSSFKIGDKIFDFSQLEYNLIQAVFYPGRFLKSKDRYKI